MTKQSLILECVICSACDMVLPVDDYMERIGAAVELYEKRFDDSPALDE